MRVRLKDNEAELFGFKLRNKEGTRNPKYTISDEQYETLKEFRNSGVVDASKNIKVEANSIKHLWKEIQDDSGRKIGNAFVKNPLFVSEIEKTYFDLRDEILKSLKKFSPKFNKINREKIKDNHLLVVDPADIHIGKLSVAFETGDDYNINKAINRVIDGVKGIIQKSNGFNIDKILFIGGNDVLHTDTPKRTTTSGTPQDTDGMWHENYLKAKQLYVDVLLMLIEVADVHFVFNPSNHDYTNGFFLADVIQTYFRNCENITFDCDISHRKYFRYHNNIIGTTHGDGAKNQDLPLLMAHECKDWNSSIKQHRYIYTHHVHHKSSKDYLSVCVESLRSPSGTDSWHHRNGYQHAPKAVEGFIHHPIHGQVARLTHLF